METIAQADIFFFVTTIAVVVVGLFALVALYYLITFLRDAHEIMHIIRSEASEIIDDIEQFRKNIEGKATRINKILGIFTTAQFLRKFLKRGSHDDEEDSSDE